MTFNLKLFPNFFLLFFIFVCACNCSTESNLTLGSAERDTENLVVGNILTDFGGKVKVPGNTILDQILENAQKTLTNYTRVYIPSFKYSNVLASVAVKNSYFEGLHSFHRVGAVTLDARPLGKTELEFGVGWTEVTAVFHIEVYPFQFGMSLIPDKLTLTLKLTNVTSVQAVSIDPLHMNFEISKFELGLGQALVGIEGFSPTASIVAKMLTAFINENKDQFLNVLSFVLKTLFNACVLGMKALVFP